MTLEAYTGKSIGSASLQVRFGGIQVLAGRQVSVSF